MAKPIVIKVTHELTAEEAKARLDHGISQLSTYALGKILSVQTAEWKEDTLSFQARALGRSWPGEIKVETGSATVTAPLPIYLQSLRSYIEEGVRTHAGNLFRK